MPVVRAQIVNPPRGARHVQQCVPHPAFIPEPGSLAGGCPDNADRGRSILRKQTNPSKGLPDGRAILKVATAASRAMNGTCMNAEALS